MDVITIIPLTGDPTIFDDYECTVQMKPEDQGELFMPQKRKPDLIYGKSLFDAIGQSNYSLGVSELFDLNEVINVNIYLAQKETLEKVNYLRSHREPQVLEHADVYRPLRVGWFGLWCILDPRYKDIYVGSGWKARYFTTLRYKLFHRQETTLWDTTGNDHIDDIEWGYKPYYTGDY